MEFDENTIRADDLVVESNRLHAEDLQRLAGRTPEFVLVECPACGGDRPSPMWDREGFSFARCGDCGTGYLNPRPTPAILDWHYRASKSHVFWAEHVYPRSEESRRQHIAKPRVTRLIDICRGHGMESGGTLLEVGAGFGTFCLEAKLSDWFSRVVAIEPTPSNAKACRERGVEVLEVQIENAKLQTEAADVVVAFEVIEHIFSPIKLIQACADALKAEGLLVLSCPNLKGFELATLGLNSPSVDPEHLNYFHPDSLSHLLQRCDFQVLEILTPGVLDGDIVRKRAAAGTIDLSSQPFLRAVLQDDWARLGAPFQRFLADNRLSSHMWVVGRSRQATR